MRIPTVLHRLPRHASGRTSTVRSGRAATWKGLARPSLGGERFRLLAENALDVIYRYRFLPTPGFDYVSPSCTAVTGYTPAEHYADPQLAHKLVHPEDRHLLKALKSEPEKPLVLRWLRKDGGLIWTEQRNKPVYDREGDLIAVEGIARDVTEAKKSEEALRRSEALASSTIDSLSAHIAILDSSGSIVAVNHAWKEFARDFADAEARDVGANYLRVCDSAVGRGARDAARFAAGIRDIISGRKTYFEMEYPCHSPGIRRWFVGRVTPFPGAGEPRVVVAHEDTTDRKLAGEAIRESEERFRAIFEQAAVGVAQVAPDGRWLKVNQKLCGILGYSEEELMGLSFQDITHPDDLDADLEYLRQLAIGERHTYSMEKRYFRKDGSVVWIDLTVSAVRKPSGDPSYFVFVVEDISARKEAEEALSDSEERLRLALEAASLGLWYQDLETNEFFASPDTAVMHGLPPDTPLDKEKAMALVHPEDRDRVLALVKRAIETRGSYEAEYRIVRPDDSVRWMVSRARVYEDGMGRLIGVAQDISGRKQAERSLLLQAQLLDHVQAAVIATDMEGTVIHWNRHAGHLYGWTQEEALGRNIMELTVGPTEAGVAEEIMAQLQSGQPWEGEFTTRRKDGTSFPAYVIDALVFEEDGRPVGVIGVSVDLTSRKEAERALRESEERFRAAFDSAAVGMALTSTEGRWLQVNRSLCEILGYSEEELLGTDFQSITHEEDLPEDLEGLRRLLEGEIRYHYSEKRYLHKDGHPVWVLLSVSLVRNADGEPLYFVTQVQDITESKRDKENLQKLSRQNEMILASAGEGIYGLDLRELTTFANPAAEEMLGYEPGELIGLHQHVIIRHSTPEGALYPEEACPVYAALRDGNVHVSSDEVFWRKDGTSFPVEFVSTPILENGEVVGAVVTFSDITERKRAEETLRRSEERFRLLAENTNDLVCLHEPDGRFLYVSPSCRRLLGYEPEDLLGTDPYALFHPEDVEPVREESHQKVLEGQLGVVTTVRIRKASGEYTWFETLTQPILDDSGAVIRLQTSSRDVSERKRAEEAVAEAARAKTEFLAEVSHELRTPLTVIRGNAEVGIDLDRECEHREILNEIVKEASTMSRMVEELLFLARSESSTPPFEMKPVAVENLLTSLARRAGSVAAGYGAKLAVSASGYGLVQADPARIEQAVLTLIENAGKYGSEGQTIALDSRVEGGELRVEVTDQGPGIPEGDLPHVFERFYRAANVGEPGNGLGLSIARTIVQAHEGRIEVASEVGQGTRVRVVLPLLPTSE